MSFISKLVYSVNASKLPVPGRLRASLTTTPYEGRSHNSEMIDLKGKDTASHIGAFFQRNYTNHSIKTWEAEVTRNCMEPSLLPGDRVRFKEVQYLGGLLDPDYPAPGTIVAFWHPVSGEGRLKRVIAHPWDRIEMKLGKLYLNGIEQEEDYASKMKKDISFPLVMIPRRHIFVLADNRLEPGDSRDFGPLHISRVFGVVKEIFRLNS